MSVTTLVKHACRRLGWAEAPAAAPRPISMLAGLYRAAQRGIPVRTVIDIGASNGCWTELARQCYPGADYFLIEAQPTHERALRELKRGNANVDYALVAAGDRNGEIYFDASDPFGGLAMDAPSGVNCITVPVRTVDSLVAERRLAPPFLMKLDTHGFEVPIFVGAGQTLGATELIIVEAYNFTLTPGCLRFHELCAYLEQRGFRCIDMCDVSRRPKDQCLWQMDLFFARGSRPEFQSSAYA